jgi:hypothetical protein
MLKFETSPNRVKFAELQKAYDLTSKEFASEFASDLEIPVVTGPQCQGDVSIRPLSANERLPKATKENKKVVGGKGYEVIRGGAMNNAHTLRSLSKNVTFQVVENNQMVFGYLSVPEGETAVLEHTEHGFNAIGPGNYVLGGQREQAEEIRQVMD